MEATTASPVKKATPEEMRAMTERAFGKAPVKTDAAPADTTTDATIQTDPAATPAPVEAKKPEATVAINTDDLTDEQIDEILAKRTKGKVKSLKDLTEDKAPETAEQKAEAARIKKQKALEWALGTEKVKQEDYDKAVVVKGKTNREIALELFTNDLKEDNPKTTAEEAEQLFQDYYMEEAEEDNSTRKLRLKEMNRTADRYRTEVTSGVDSIEADYDNYQEGEGRYKSYGAQVENIFETLPKERTLKFSYTGPGNTTIEAELPYTIDEADIKSIKRNIKSANAWNALGGNKNNLKDKDIIGAIEYDLRATLQEKLFTQIAIAAAKKGSMDTEAHFKAIPTRTTQNFTAMSTENNNTQKRQPTAEERSRFPSSKYGKN